MAQPGSRGGDPLHELVIPSRELELCDIALAMEHEHADFASEHFAEHAAKVRPSACVLGG